MSELWHRLLLAHDYALINPLQVGSTLWADLPTSPLIPQGLGDSAKLMPRLLSLAELSVDERVSLIDRVDTQTRKSRFPYFSALIASDAGSELMANRLRRRLRAHTRDGDILFRYYDPRVFQHLGWLLRPIQFAFLLVGIDAWSWRDMTGDWRTTKSSVQNACASMRLTEDESDRLKRIHLVNRVLREVQDASDSPDVMDERVAKTVDTLLAEAVQKGLRQSDDSCCYAVQGLRHGTDIFEHPDLALRLARASRQEQSYTSATSDLDDAVLARYARELHESKGAIHV